mmetsp:Transcript_30976/g.69716  ORF Transcript_30976/g.69716 Transcript_30976/m.69716 type:complete len:425 (-) Transcript_30976:148-1422(-)
MLTSVALLLACAPWSHAEVDWQWTAQRGTGQWDYATALQLDARGNLLVVGDAAGALDNATSAGSRDFFLMEFDGSGAWQWTRQHGAKEADSARAMQLDQEGNILVVGYTSSALDGNVHQGGSDIFVSKFDRSGSLLWTRQHGTGDWDYGHALQVDNQSNILVAGYTGGTLDGHQNAGSYDFFIMKLDASGSWLWTRQRGSASWDFARALRLDRAGNVFVAGYTRGSLNGHANAGGKDIFLSKFDAEGSWQWTQQQGSAGDDDAMDLGIDSFGNVLVAGETSGSLGNKNLGSSDVFLMKFGNAGECEWIRQRGTSSFDVAWALEVDLFNNIWVAGYTGGSMDGHASAGSSDVFLMMFDASGSWVWTEQRGTPRWDYARALKISEAGDAFIAGATMGNLDEGDFRGGEDLFVMKFSRADRTAELFP